MSITSDDFMLLVQRARNELNLSEKDIRNLTSVNYIRNEGLKRTSFSQRILLSGLLFLILVALPSSVFWSIYNETEFGKFTASKLFDVFTNYDGIEEADCLIPAPEIIADKFRNPVDCHECAGIKGIKRLKNLSPDDFLENYAFSMQPILIEDGQDNWTATQTFDFSFFKDVYSDAEALAKVEKDCQFFPYSTELETLGEFFNMSKDRIEGNEKPWYVGWSNCDGKTANRLREHYRVPYFLPRYLDQSNTDWVFMGLPGYGANMHIDNVGTLSWQAQIKGTKKWMLQSPPECYWECIDEMEVIVKPGEIIVLDTNKWFHATEIIGNETSIVIGSEYY